MNKKAFLGKSLGKKRKAFLGKSLGKKGALPIEFTIIIILAVITLIIIIIFALGGFGVAISKVKSIFYGTTVGTDRTIAFQTCQDRCERERDLVEMGTPQKSISFCRDPFYIDEDGDNEADKTTDGKYKKFYCYKESKSEEIKSLEIACNALIKGIETPITCSS